MKRAMLCLLLLSGCLNSSPPPANDYVLTWTCLSSEGCEHVEEVERIDRMERIRLDCHFTSTQDETFGAEGTRVLSDFLPPGCSWLYFLSLFDHELERSRFCFIPGGFELELAIPNQDPSTHSMWLVDGRDVNLL